MAATIITKTSNQVQQTSVPQQCMVSVYPMACYFETFPSLRDLVDDSVADVVSKYGAIEHKMFLFTPLAVSSFDIHANYEMSPDLEKGQFGELLALCREHKAKGIFIAVRSRVFSLLCALIKRNVFFYTFYQGNLSKNAFECGYSQRMISILNHLCKPLFPEMVLSGVNGLPPNHSTSGDLSHSFVQKSQTFPV